MARILLLLSFLVASCSVGRRVDGSETPGAERIKTLRFAYIADTFLYEEEVSAYRSYEVKLKSGGFIKDEGKIDHRAYKDMYILYEPVLLRNLQKKFPQIMLDTANEASYFWTHFVAGSNTISDSARLVMYSECVRFSRMTLELELIDLGYQSILLPSFNSCAYGDDRCHKSVHCYLIYRIRNSDLH